MLRACLLAAVADERSGGRRPFALCLPCLCLCLCLASLLHSGASALSQLGLTYACSRVVVASRSSLPQYSHAPSSAVAPRRTEAQPRKKPSYESRSFLHGRDEQPLRKPIRSVQRRLFRSVALSRSVQRLHDPIRDAAVDREQGGVRRQAGEQPACVECGEATRHLAAGAHRKERLHLSSGRAWVRGTTPKQSAAAPSRCEATRDPPTADQTRQCCTIVSLML